MPLGIEGWNKLPESGAHTVTAGEATANAAVISTGKSIGFMVQIFRAGVDVTADAAISQTGGALTVADGAATYSVTAGDVINWIAF